MHDDEGNVERMRVALLALRAAIVGAGAPILGSFSYADILMATLVQGVLPVSDAYWAIGPGTRRVWTHARLSQEFPDLLVWRDAIYQAHRGTLAARVTARARA